MKLRHLHELDDDARAFAADVARLWRIKTVIRLAVQYAGSMRPVAHTLDVARAEPPADPRSILHELAAVARLVAR